MLFVLSLAWDKKNPSSHKESNLRPSDSALRCSTTEPQRLHCERGLSRILYHTRLAYRYDPQCLKNIFFYFFTELKTYYLSVSYFYLKTLRHRHGWFQPWSLWGSVVEHRNAESEGLRFDSSWRHRFFFSLSHARDMTKNIFLYLYQAQNLPSLLFLSKKILQE